MSVVNAEENGKALSGLSGLSVAELEELMVRDGLARTHGLRLFKAVHQVPHDLGESRGMLPPPVQRWLDGPEGLGVAVAEEVRETESGDGWTRKYLLRMWDGQEVESVLMGFPGRFTACLSTQVGCAMGCVFCATGQMGLARHLAAGEIVAQALHVARRCREVHGERLRNLVVMGMGEPLHNAEATLKALEVLTDTRGLGIGPAHVTLSTVGHVPGIRKVARHPLRFRLAVSLHAATDEERSELVPVNRRWPLAEVLEACAEYSELTGERVFMAWTLIAGKNDSEEQARQLAALLAGRAVQVNLIPLNPTEGFAASAPTEERVEAFQRVLLEAGLPVTRRQRRGIDVGAGCGQLRSERRLGR
jgi:23S rRNA (adenine2503-C2)-methyltransferase